MHFVTCTAYYVSLRLYMHAGRSDLSAHNSTSAAVPVPVCVVSHVQCNCEHGSLPPDFFNTSAKSACMYDVCIHPYIYLQRAAC